MSRPLRALAPVLLVCLAASPAAAQEPRTALAPDTVTVGDVFRAAIRLELPPGHRAEAPDTLPVAGDLENAGRAERRAEPLPGGGERLTITYALSAWRPGPTPLPAVPLRIVGPGTARQLEAPLPAVLVRSVLPTDTAGIQPRPVRDVVGPDRARGPLLLALLLLGLVLAALAYAFHHRRRRTADAGAPVRSPRERALAALDEARAAGLLEAGEFKAFYSRITDALRQYLEDLEPAWGRDLTTSEILARLAGRAESDGCAALARILGEADLVKFARRPTTVAAALQNWEAARAWILTFAWPPEPAAVPAEARPEAA